MCSTTYIPFLYQKDNKSKLYQRAVSRPNLCRAPLYISVIVLIDQITKTQDQFFWVLDHVHVMAAKIFFKMFTNIKHTGIAEKFR